MTKATRSVLGQFIIVLAAATLIVTGFNALSHYADKTHAAEMDARAKRAALFLSDGHLIGSCGKDRCVITGDER